MLNLNYKEVSKVIYVPHTEKEYKKLVNQLDELIDKVGNNEKHPLASIMETIGVLVSNYESKNFPINNISGISALKFLLKEHGLKQTDLKEIGSQGIVSEILNCKRELNIRQIRSLAKRFSVSPAVFI